MGRPRKLLRLSWPDRALLLKTAFLLGAIRLGLWLLPFDALRRLLLRRGRGRSPAREHAAVSAKSVGWAVRVAARYVPGATCLTQALVAMVLLRRNGRTARLRIGIAKDGDGRLQAHAWVESCGKIVVGKRPDLARYTLLPHIEKRML